MRSLEAALRARARPAREAAAHGGRDAHQRRARARRRAALREAPQAAPRARRTARPLRQAARQNTRYTSAVYCIYSIHAVTQILNSGYKFKKLNCI